jgi:preprotein translocase subunit SecD
MGALATVGERRMKTTVSAIAGVAVAALMVTACTSSGSSAVPAGTPAPSTTSAPAAQQVVSITLSPVAPASAAELAAAAKLISERVAQSGLPVTSAAGSNAGAATVSGGNVVLTGPAADKTALEGLAGMGVLRLRHVLLEEPAGGAATGDASLVQPGVLKLFRKLACTSGESDAAWQREAGYTQSADWNDPAAQVVSCGSGTKYVLDVATVLGQEVTRAVLAPSSSGQPLVVLTVDSTGTSAFTTLTTHLYKTYYSGTTAQSQNDMVLDQVAFVLDGAVLTAPEVEAPITGGQLQIPGNFTEAAATELAAELQSGPLPVAFRVAGTSVSS